MQILCAYSSITFTVEHFPGTLSSRESYHPVFDMPQKRLLSNLGKWSSGGLTPTDSYLMFLAVLRSTDLVDFRVPAIRTEKTDATIAQNMEALCRTVIRLNSVSNPAVCFPLFVLHIKGNIVPLLFEISNSTIDVLFGHFKQSSRMPFPDTLLQYAQFRHVTDSRRISVYALRKQSYHSRLCKF